MIETLQDRIIRHEGFCEFPKADAKGFYVIGFGHDITKAEIDQYSFGISQKAALQLLEKDIEICENALARELPWVGSLLSEIRQEVLTEMIFQMGVNGLLGFKNLLFNARSENPQGVANAMLDSEWHKETPSRCEELANLYLTNGEHHELMDQNQR